MAKKKQSTSAIESESFEESIAKLSQIVRDLEDGSLSLDESLENYEQGIRYLKHCQEILSKAERKIEVLSGFDADGNPVTQRFDDEEMSLQEKADKRSRRRTAKPAAKDGSRKAISSSEQDETDTLESGDVDENGTLF